MKMPFFLFHVGLLVSVMVGLSALVHRAEDNVVNKIVSGEKSVSFRMNDDGTVTVPVLGTSSIVCGDGQVVSLDNRLEKYPDQTQAICERVKAMMKPPE